MGEGAIFVETSSIDEELAEVGHVEPLLLVLLNRWQICIWGCDGQLDCLTALVNEFSLRLLAWLERGSSHIEA